MREIVPSATAVVTAALPGAGPREVTVATVLPGGMPALHRADGELLVALQSRTSSGDASRDLAQALVAASNLEPGSPLPSVRPATLGSPRLQDLLADQPLSVRVHEDFSFWAGGEEGKDDAARALEQAHETAVPTVKLEELPSAYWCQMGERAYIRWVLAQDEDEATMALARLQAADEHTLGSGTTLLGAFRAAGLLVPVFEVDPAARPEEHTVSLVAMAGRYADALAVSDTLTPQERRARDGLVSRQVTLR